MKLSKQLGRGIAFGLLLDFGATALFFLVASSAAGPWVLVLLWVMAVLAVTGIELMESRWWAAAGFWLVHLGFFTLWLLGVMKLLVMLSETRG